MSDEGDIAGQPLVDALLHPDASHDCVEVAFALGDIHKADDHSPRGVQDELAVGQVVPDREGQVEEVHLKQQKGFVLRRTEVLDLEGSNAGQFAVVDVLVVAEGGLLELVGLRHQLEQVPELHPLDDGVTELPDCGVLEVVAAGDEAEFGGLDVGLPVLGLVLLDDPRVAEGLEYLGDRIQQELLDGCIFVAEDVVEVGVLQDSPEQETPGYPLDAVLGVVYLSPRNLGTDVVR